MANSEELRRIARVVNDLELVINSFARTTDPKKQELLAICYNHRLKDLISDETLKAYNYYKKVYDEIINYKEGGNGESRPIRESK